MSINELSVRLLHAALPRRVWSEDYAYRRSLQTLEASHAIFGDQNGSGPTWNLLWLACYSSVVPLIRPCYFLHNSAFNGHFLRAPLYFPCYLQWTASARPHGAFALCTECIAFDNCAMSNNSNAITFGVCQPAKRTQRVIRLSFRRIG